MSENNIKDLVQRLQLIPHPEGGFYRETYRSIGEIPGTSGFPSGRNYATSIYFLITHEKFSALHRIRSDETWHFYEGDPIEIIELDPSGNSIHTFLGEPGKMNFQHTVPAGNWFGSRVKDGGVFSLVG